jgi:hypothetical protein
MEPVKLTKAREGANDFGGGQQLFSVKGWSENVLGSLAVPSLSQLGPKVTGQEQLQTNARQANVSAAVLQRTVQKQALD